MRIYIESTGEQGVGPNTGWAIGPRADGRVYIDLTRHDLDSIRALDDQHNHAEGLIVGFQHPDYDVDTVPGGQIPPDKIVRMFASLEQRMDAKHLHGRGHVSFVLHSDGDD